MSDLLPAPPGGGLWPAEKMALTVARSQVARGAEVDPNVAAVCVMALARLAGERVPSPRQVYTADVTDHPDLQFDDVGGGPQPPTAVLVTLWASDDTGSGSPGEVAFRVDDRWGLPARLLVAP